MIVLLFTKDNKFTRWRCSAATWYVFTPTNLFICSSFDCRPSQYVIMFMKYQRPCFKIWAVFLMFCLFANHVLGVSTQLNELAQSQPCLQRGLLQYNRAALTALNFCHLGFHSHLMCQLTYRKEAEEEACEKDQGERNAGHHSHGDGK